MADHTKQPNSTHSSHPVESNASLECDHIFPLSAPYCREVLVARNVATNILDGTPAIASALFPKKFSRDHTSRIREKYFIPIDFASTTEEISENASERDKEFRDKLIDPLYYCLFHSEDLPITKKARVEFDSLVSEITKDANEVRTAIRQRNDLDPKEPVKGDHDEHLVEAMREKVRKVQKILRNPQNLTGIPPTAPPLLSMAFRLNDISLRLLATCEKYKLVSAAYLTETVNEKTEIAVFFNYILRYGAWGRDLFALYLNHDLKRSVEESPFTAEIHGLLKYIKQNTWKELERNHIYITVLLGSAGLRSNPLERQAAHVTELGKAFYKLTSSEISHAGKTDAFPEEMVELFVKDLFNAMLAALDFYDDITIVNLLMDLKILNSMFDFMVKYHFISDELISKIKSSQSYFRINEFSRAMVILTNTSKTIYDDYRVTLQNIASEPEAFDVCLATPQAKYVKIYLTDSKLVNEGTLLLRNELRDDTTRRLNEKTPEKLYESSESPSRGESVASYHKRNYLSSDDPIFSNPWNIRQNVSTIVLNKSRQFLKTFEARDGSLNDTTNPIVSTKERIEKIFNEILK